MAKFYNMMTGKEEIEMTSLEIAEVTGKKHFHVKRDIRNLLTRLGKDPSKFESISVDSMNREQTIYKVIDKALKSNWEDMLKPMLEDDQIFDKSISLK